MLFQSLRMTKFVVIVFISLFMIFSDESLSRKEI